MIAAEIVGERKRKRASGPFAVFFFFEGDFVVAWKETNNNGLIRDLAVWARFLIRD
jgi:hypothetical protein